MFPKLLCLAASLHSIVEHTLGSSVFNTNTDSSRREKELECLPVEEEAKLALKAILWTFKKMTDLVKISAAVFLLPSPCIYPSFFFLMRLFYVNDGKELENYVFALNRSFLRVLVI